MYQSIGMFENLPQSDSGQTESEKSTSSPEGFRAKTLAVQVKELVSMIQTGKLPEAVCGQSTPVSLAKLSPAGSWLKMFGDSCQSLLWEQQGEDSELYSGTWPTWGIVLDGCVLALPMLERRTEGNGCLLLPSPRANDAEKRGSIANDPRSGLPATVQHWPTPATRDYKGANGEAHFLSKDRPHADQLPNAVKIANWPTPKIPSGGGQVQRNTPGGGIRKLEDAISAEVGYNTGQLNADWVEILMGYAIGYTDIDCANPTEWPGWPAGLGAREWMTPNVPNGGRAIPNDVTMRGKSLYTQDGRKVQYDLNHQVKQWATPQAMDHRTDVRAPGQHSEKAKQGGCCNLREQVAAASGQYPYEPPRVITGQKNRAKRLKCLGNAVVPQQPYSIFKAINDLEMMK